MEINNSYFMHGSTSKGTKIVEKGKGLDKNSFFKILSAQLMNQDPSKPADSTEFVAQLAQFTTLEEMENLNKTSEFKNAYGLVGKTVAFDSYNYKGEQYGGVVKSIEQTPSGPLIITDVMENGKSVEKKFKLSDVSNVYHQPNQFLSSINSNIDFHAMVSLIGKTIKGSHNEGVFEGTVKSTYKTSEGVKAIVDVKGKVISSKMEKKESYNDKDIYLNGVYKNDEAVNVMVMYDGTSSSENKYSYKVVPTNQNADEIQWSEYVPDSEVLGMKILLPNEEPELPCNWEVSLSAFEPKEMHFYSSNILEAGE
ncbi:flagellar hook assembly protein FlgD [Oceanirhabdus sp. W0125-5]|uniref:flagellar hook assembly protein FlgD n=1 Tax=Oceanirhabdus sp. W0125-5 TaxID=2999116 RepID=UPI0022F30D78|nr:flagellar hook capping FlgD N-terminal domain-containing protein [Oceanirhabdus sp. W0125-5]WBW95425.1 flagellar hook capping FlgD N-terminal domain-containing protein [Oceanirhabdus sp. W0125-5]